MTCESCVKDISNAVYKLEGITKVEGNLPEQLVTIEGTGTSYICFCRYFTNIFFYLSTISTLACSNRSSGHWPMHTVPPNVHPAYHVTPFVYPPFPPFPLSPFSGMFGMVLSGFPESELPN